MARKTGPGLIFSLLDTPAFGGAEQYLLAHLEYLAQQGYQVVLPTNNQAVKDRVKANHPRIECCHAPYLLDAIGNWKGLVKYFLSLPVAISWLIWTIVRLKADAGAKPCIALLPGFSDRLTFSPFFKWLGWQLIWIEIGPLEPTFKKNWGFPKLLYRLISRFPDQLVTTSKFTWQSMERVGNLGNKPVTLVYPGIQPVTAKQITSLKRRGQELRRDHQLQAKQLLVFTGRLASENEVELVIRALDKLRSKKAFLVIIGDGPERKTYENLVKKLHLESQVLFTGFVSEADKFAWQATAEAVVFTRSWDLDGFGMVTIEGMSVGTAVINPEFGPQSEIGEDGKTNLRFRPKDADDLAHKIRQLLAQPKLRQRLAQAGYVYVHRAFNQNHQLKLMHDIVRQASYNHS